MLQWGHVLIDVEVTKTKGTSHEHRDQASMGPRLDRRGSATIDTDPLRWLAELQWGHVLIDVEV